MKMVKLTLLLSVLVCTICLFSEVYGGWDHAPGKTFWNDRPTPATCWRRDGNGDLIPAFRVQVFDNTIRHYDPAVVGSLTNHPVTTGFWTMDSSRNLTPNSNIAATYCTTNRYTQGMWLDVEWLIDSDGNLRPKK